jgi:hypothetical protein
MTRDALGHRGITSASAGGNARIMSVAASAA